MRFRGRTLTTIDIAVAVAAAAVLLLGGYLGWSVWSQSRAVVAATPASRAIDEMVAHLRRYPDDVGVRLQLAQALVVARRDSEAINHYRAVLKSDEDNIPSLAGLGFLASQRRDWKTAEGYWQRVIDILSVKQTSGQDPTLEKAYFYMGTILTEQQRWEDAVPYLKAALRIRRDASDTHYLLAVAFRESGSEEKYREELTIALAFDPLMPEANYDMGRVLLEDGDEAGAAEYFRKSVDAAPAIEMPQRALDELGPYEERLDAARALSAGDPEAALAEARIAVALEPREPEALHVLAGLFEKTGDRSRATEAWRRAVALDGSDATATAALERLAAGAK